VATIWGPSVSVESKTIPQLVDMVHQGDFVIPDFQRDVVWQPAQVAALWDSVYRGFPIGSLLYWTTTERMATLRAIGGFDLSAASVAGEPASAIRYVLDGQQRLTAFFISMVGGKKRLKNDSRLDYAIYFDPTAEVIPTVRVHTASGDESRAYAARYFIFEGERERRAKELRQANVSPDLIVRLNGANAVSPANCQALAREPGYGLQIGQSLERLQRALHEYQVPLVCVNNASAEEVSEIFQRVNTRGVQLTSFDLAVARTMRSAANGAPAFSLRERVTHLKHALALESRGWERIDNLSLLRMIVYCLRRLQDLGDLPKYPRISADNKALPNIGAHDLTGVLDRAEDAIVRAVRFFISQGAYKPELISAEYLPLPVCAHLLDHSYAPDASEWTQLSRWYWRYAFDRQGIRGQSDADHALSLLNSLTPKTPLKLPPLHLTPGPLIKARKEDALLYRAAWSFFSYLGPRDFATGDYVSVDPARRWKPRASEILTQPSRHHIFPIKYLTDLRKESQRFDPLSVMNIAVISIQTNSEISHDSPHTYIPSYAQKAQKRGDDFNKLMASHLIPDGYFDQDPITPSMYREFLNRRAQLVLARLRAELGLTITEN
jgi:hypothetical protein